MSNIINVSAHNSVDMFVNDDTLQPADYRVSVSYGITPLAPELWNSPQIAGYDMAGLFGMLQRRSYEPVSVMVGTKARKIISGLTLNSSGVAVGGVTVRGFQQSNHEYIGSVVSAPDGSYSLPTPYSTAHYVVAYLAGSPDTAGTTVNNLTGV